MEYNPNEDFRKFNGHDRDKMLQISGNGTVSTSHGGYQFLSRGFAVPNKNCEFYPGCKCKDRCRALDKLAGEMEAELMSLPHIEPVDLYLVRQFVKLTIFQIVVDRWLLKNDIIIENKGQLKMQPVFNVYFQILNSSQRLGDRLGLTPMSRKELERKGKTPLNEFAKAILELQEAEVEDRSPTGIAKKVRKSKELVP